MQPTNIGIVTTASLPWLTGTSIIPLFHAVYLKKRGFQTTLYLPWLPPEQQNHCFQDKKFNSPEDQQAFILDWLPEEVRGFCPEVRFYPARYYSFIESIGPLVDLNKLVKNHEVVILEEPEHLFASRPWSGIKKRQALVVGVVMTNYQYYHSQYIPSFLARWYQHYSRFLMRRMCRRIVTPAAAQPEICAMPICEVAAINGAIDRFFRPPPIKREATCYFIGKLIPEKGLEEMFRNLAGGGMDRIDLYGQGQIEWVRRTAERYGVRPVIKGPSFQPWEEMRPYRIFVNCSRSEYLCATTVEALAMQQWAIVPRQESNRFFFQFNNCLTYSSPEEFKERLEHARTHEPEFDPLTDLLTWESALDRLTEFLGLKENPKEVARRFS